MRFLWPILLVLALAGCVSSGDQKNIQEASRINTQLGIDYARNGQLALAQEKLLKALEQDSNNALAHAALAFVYQQLADSTAAERHYRRALSLNPGDSQVRNNFGVFLCGRGKREEGETYLLQASRDKRYATPEVALTNAGVCYRGKEADKAEGYFREALRANPAFPDALSEMTALCVQRQDYICARAFVQRFEQAGQMTPKMLWLAAQAEAGLGDRETSRKYQIRLKREFPDSEEAAMMLKTYQ
ncbi:type IV pilus biogenesis/stability protein PilW [Solimonas sp. K1W22B-7]|uniref:type IV pilus biogenesis/stability protein PilW n=1 Tax=Solimonas sp. K1W22B-7 TaxID=2303331 RepID=UPI000E334747|nr:type IV pilus biogenesis/stability protein PilW [Solimonas sp. K1W22B-7]AXQ29885.1 type IV pilus biogenesis/stability protein PilW [Solimonas sp. K1W22B-7]